MENMGKMANKMVFIRQAHSPVFPVDMRDCRQATLARAATFAVVSRIYCDAVVSVSLWKQHIS
jgi:hypothetical protein